MARQIQKGSRVTQLRRLWPYVLMAWERWQQLPDEDKERYKRQAREYAERGRKAVGERRKRRPPRKR
jgi:TRAP-type C4-dicarboxylate transport system substrate-binding protein